MIEAHLDDIVALDNPIEGAIVIGEAEIVDVFPSAVLRLCCWCCEDLLVPNGAYHYRYESENLSADLQTSDDGVTITVSGSGCRTKLFRRASYCRPCTRVGCDTPSYSSGSRRAAGLA